MKTHIEKTGKIPCRVPGCQHEPFNSTNAERTHYHRSHSGKIRVRGQKEGPVKLDNGSSPAPPIAALTVEPVELPADRPSPEQEVKAKRKYTRHKQVVNKSTKQVQVDVKWCADCGLDLMAVAAELALRGINRTVKICPCCGLDLVAVAVGMATSKLKKQYAR